MSAINYQPWVGSKYLYETRKLLILGESHYGSEEGDDTDQALTKEVVERWCGGDSVRFFDDLLYALAKDTPLRTERREFLATFAFYNYVTAIMPSREHRPTTADFRGSEPAFREVLEALRPTHLLVCGRSLWDSMPRFDGNGSELILGGEPVSVGAYRAGRAAAWAMHIKHPSSIGFSGSQWCAKIEDFRRLPPIVSMG